ncbi:MAG: hypothetical protein ACP5VS_00930, partial [Desulfomonilaceae bacterium]
MKILFPLSLAICLCVSVVGTSAGQDYYGDYYGNQGYDRAYGRSGYNQSYQNYGQEASSGYGSPYSYGGQAAASPQGYPPSYGYDPYPGVPGYGRYDNTPYGAGNYDLPPVSNHYRQPTLRSRLNTPTGRPEIRQTTRVVSPSRNQGRTAQQPTMAPTSRNSEDDGEGSLYTNEIYWNGGESGREQLFQSPSQSRPIESNSQANPRAISAVPQVKPFSNTNSQSRVQRTRRDVVRQGTKSVATVPPPPTSGFKWGKEHGESSQQASQSKQSFKWGAQ